MEEGNSHRVFDPLMEKEVEEEAIRRVASILSTTDALPRASQHRLQLLRKREILTSKISSMVQNSLSETEFALQTVKSNLDRSNSVQDKFQELVAHCLDCQNILNAKEYPFIKAIRFARKNLESTIRLFTLFQEIPQTAEALVAALESGEINLKDAYLEIRRLYRIRERARVQGEKYAEKFLQLFEKQFESVRVAIKTLEYLLLQDIEKAIDLSGDDPVRLVSSLQVVEMEDRAKKYKIFQEANPHLSAQRHQSMREKVFDRMEKSIAEFFAKMFQDSVTSMEYKREGQESDKTLAEVLKIGNKVVCDFSLL